MSIMTEKRNHILDLYEMKSKYIGKEISFFFVERNISDIKKNYIYKINIHFIHIKLCGGLHREVANMMDCDIVVSEFKLQSNYYIHFRTNTLGKGMNSLIPTPSNGLNSTITRMDLAFHNPWRMIYH